MRARSERAQAAAELAVCLPVMVLVLGAIFVFGQALLEMQHLSAAASEGARANAYAATESGCSSKVDDAVRNAAELSGGRLAPGSLSVTDDCGALTGSVTVTVTYPMQISFGPVSIDKTVSRSRTMRVMT